MVFRKDYDSHKENVNELLDKSVEATLDDGEFEVLLIKAPTRCV